MDRVTKSQMRGEEIKKCHMIFFFGGGGLSLVFLHVLDCKFEFHNNYGAGVMGYGAMYPKGWGSKIAQIGVTYYLNGLLSVTDSLSDLLNP